MSDTDAINCKCIFASSDILHRYLFPHILYPSFSVALPSDTGPYMNTFLMQVSASSASAAAPAAGGRPPVRRSARQDGAGTSRATDDQGGWVTEVCRPGAEEKSSLISQYGLNIYIYIYGYIGLQSRDFALIKL